VTRVSNTYLMDGPILMHNSSTLIFARRNMSVFHQFALAIIFLLSYTGSESQPGDLPWLGGH